MDLPTKQDSSQSAVPPVLEKKRYHDLDALRAGAMLLGILLHGVISFMGEPYWPIQDSQSPFWEVPAGGKEAGAAMGMALPALLEHLANFFGTLPGEEIDVKQGVTPLDLGNQAGT